jgi:hypothetical protein
MPKSLFVSEKRFGRIGVLPLFFLLAVYICLFFVDLRSLIAAVFSAF